MKFFTFFLQTLNIKTKKCPETLLSASVPACTCDPYASSSFFFFFLAISVYTPEGYVSDEASSSRTNSILRLGESV